MAQPTLVPDKSTLRRLIEDEGLTHREIAAQYGVARTSISAAAVKYGLSAQMTRHEDTVPWKVKVRHAREYPVRMLRLLGRRRKGMSLSANEEKMLDGFLAKLTDEKAVVAYDPNSLEGFFYIDRKYHDHKDKSIPVRVKPINTTGA